MARGADFTRQREVVEAFLAASRDGYFEALLAVLDPGCCRSGRPRCCAAWDISGAPRCGNCGQASVHRVAPRSVRSTRTRERNCRVVDAPRGRLPLAMAFKVTDGKIVEIDVIANPQRLRQLDLAALYD